MTWKQFLWQPFQHLGGLQALLLGLLAMLAMSLVGWAEHLAFDGVLDAHYSTKGGPFWLYLVFVVGSWLVFGSFLLGIGLVVSSVHVRLIDIFGPLAMAKWVYLIPALLSLVVPWEGPTAWAEALIQPGVDAPEVTPLQWGLFIGHSIITLCCTGWYVYLAYQGYSLATNLRGGKAVLSFATALVLAEVAVKALQFSLPWLINYLRDALTIF